MAAFRWKSISSLDGSERTFWERVRNPDANFPRLLFTLAVFLPIGFGFLMIPLAVLPALTEAVLGSQSTIVHVINVVSFYVLKSLTYAFLLAFLGMYGLRVYVGFRLRRQRRSSNEAS
jgi:hypothetical protein